MSQSSLQAGRFVVITPTHRISGLGAHEVEFAISDVKSEGVQVCLIHRVTPEGNIEMLGVEPAHILRRECLILAWEDIKSARACFERLRAASELQPPPCHIELQLVRVPEWKIPCVVAMVFPAPCQQSVRVWQRLIDPHAPESSPGRDAIELLRQSHPQILESIELRTWDLGR